MSGAFGRSSQKATPQKRGDGFSRHGTGSEAKRHSTVRHSVAEASLVQDELACDEDEPESPQSAKATPQQSGKDGWVSEFEVRKHLLVREVQRALYGFAERLSAGGASGQ